MLLNYGFQIQQADSRKPAFRWLGSAGKPKAENGVTIAVPPPGKTISNKRAFGTELTNIDINRSRLDSTIPKKAKLTQSGGEILKNCKLSVQKQLGQGSKGGFVYGPFHPAGARKQELDNGNKGHTDNVQNWESLAASFRPQYQNQGGLNSSLTLYKNSMILFHLLDKKKVILFLWNMTWVGKSLSLVL